MKTEGQFKRCIRCKDEMLAKNAHDLCRKCVDYDIEMEKTGGVHVNGICANCHDKTPLGIALCQKCIRVDDPVNHPPHYTNHPSGIECIQITRHMGFNLGNAIKYIWRADLKGNSIEDLHKAAWYIRDEIILRESKK